MKKIILLLPLILFPIVCRADFDPAQWRYHKDLTNTGAGLVRFSIDDQIFAGTEKDLRDLRIIDNDGRETPFELVLGKIPGQSMTLSPKMINNSYRPDEVSSVILDFGDNFQGVNRLLINTATENFQRNVTIFGSDDMNTWSILKDRAYVYDYTDRRGGLKSRNTTLDFPESLFRYLKIEIADEDKRPVRIDSVAGTKYVPAQTKEFVREPAIDVRNAGTGDTEVYIDLGASGVPVSRLILAADNENFNRSVSVYSSYDNGTWHNIGQGYVFRYLTPKFTGENLELNFSETNERYLKLAIRNNDDAPLNISGVKAFSVYREVLFEAEADKAYRVYYGYAGARWPQYDFEKYFQYLNLDSARDAGLSAQADNARYVNTAKLPVTPKSETMPYLMPAALIAASLLLLFLIYGFFKKKTVQ